MVIYRSLQVYPKSIQSKVCRALFIDFAKAFDIINHDLRLKVITLYGLLANTPTLISTFLSSRLQKVSLKDNNQILRQFYLEFPKDLS